tara:strand:- start:4299 stop:4577 length:279 start_codon:yes stop_codon:yes gene_type:complete
MLNITNYLLAPQYIETMTEMMNVIELLNDNTSTEEEILEAWNKVQEEYKNTNIYSVTLESEKDAVETLDRLAFQVKVRCEALYIRRSESKNG